MAGMLSNFQWFKLQELETKLASMMEEPSTRKPGKAEEILLTSKEIAPYLGLKHHKTVEKWVRTKGLPCVWLGRNLRFRLGDVLRWLDQQR